MPAEPLVAGDSVPRMRPLMPSVRSDATASGANPQTRIHGVRNTANITTSSATSDPIELTMVSRRISASASSETRYAPAACTRTVAASVVVSRRASDSIVDSRANSALQKSESNGAPVGLTMTSRLRPSCDT